MINFAKGEVLDTVIIGHTTKYVCQA